MQLSVVLPAKLGFHSVQAAIDAWLRQEDLDAFEVVVVFPAGLGPSEEQLRALPARIRPLAVENADLHELRARAVEAAHGDYIMLAEDHCLPDADWLANMLPRIEEGWDGIGSALRPGTRGSCWPEASFLIGYGEWMEPVAAGPVNVICGWNGVVRRSLLLAFGDGLADEMLVGAFAMRRVRERGASFFLAPEASMRHFDPFGCRYEMGLLFLVGLGFGAKRAERLSFLPRLVYPLASPLIAVMHWRRALSAYWRTRRIQPVSPLAVLASGALAVSWALGEAAGSWLGLRTVAPWLWRTEVKPVTAASVASADEREATLRS